MEYHTALSLGATPSCYTLFSLAPLLLIEIAVAGPFGKAARGKYAQHDQSRAFHAHGNR